MVAWQCEAVGRRNQAVSRRAGLNKGSVPDLRLKEQPDITQNTCSTCGLAKDPPSVSLHNPLNLKGTTHYYPLKVSNQAKEIMSSPNNIKRIIIWYRTARIQRAQFKTQSYAPSTRR